MKPFALILLLLLLVAAQALSEDADEESGLSLMERGAHLFFEGLMSEIEPTLDEMQSLAEEFGPAMTQMFREMGPALAELLESIDDLANYEPPVLMPNGDIVIKRTPEAPEFSPLPEVGEGGDVEL